MEDRGTQATCKVGVRRALQGRESQGPLRPCKHGGVITSAYKSIVPALSLVAAIFVLTGCGHPAEANDKTHNPISIVKKPRYDYEPLMGFHPILPTQSFQLQQVRAYVFKYVNPPWGTVDPQVIETWGNDTAFDEIYIAPDGSGKSFTIMETKMGANALPTIETPWRSVHKKSETFYENNIPGYGPGVALIKNGVLYLVSSYTSGTHGFTTSQLGGILESLRTPVRTAPDMIKTQTFGFTKAPTAVPFAALVPTIPATWHATTAVGEDVALFGLTGRKGNQQHMGRLTLTYDHNKTQLKILEGLGMKYVNPNVAKAQNGVIITLNDGQKAIFIDGGQAVAFVDGGGSNRKVVTWTTKSGVNITIIGSEDLTENDLVSVANSFKQVK